MRRQTLGNILLIVTKIATKILAVWGCIATLPLIYFLCRYLDSEGIVEFGRHKGVNYYYSADLQTMKLPPWNPTNAIPLSPDAAVKAAMRYASGRYPGVTTWDTDRISLEQDVNAKTWHYEILLMNRQSGGYESENVYVLMNGNIWKPEKVERKR